jgi:hypothetical protein
MSLYIKRILSILLSVSIALTSTYGYGYPTLFGSKPHTKRYLTEDGLAGKRTDIAGDPGSITIPEPIGRVIDTHKGKGDSLVIHIQDRHIDPVAQLNIAKIIDEFTEKYDTHLMCLEGASKELKTSFYDKFPDSKIKTKVAEFFVEKGLFTGAEFYKITNTDKYLNAQGAENKAAYLEHLASYKENGIDKDKILKFLKAVDISINILKKKVYSKLLKDIDKKARLYYTKQLKLPEYLKALQYYSKNAKVDILKYKNLNKFIRLIEKEKSVDFKDAQAQREELIKHLSENLENERLQELLKNSLDFKLNKLLDLTFYTYLEKFLKSKTYNLELTAYSCLTSYIDYLKFSKEINHLKVFDEAEDLEEKLMLALSKTPIQKNLVLYSKSVKILQDLYSLKLNPRQLYYLDKNSQSSNIANIRQFLKTAFAEYGLNLSHVVASTYIEQQAIDNSKRYYQLALKRDIALVNNTLKAMSRTRKDRAMLITGGFHTQGITNILKDKDISYVVICPGIGTEDYERLYSDRMAGILPDIAELTESFKHALSVPLVSGDLCPRGMTEYVEGAFKEIWNIAEQGKTSSAGEETIRERAIYNELKKMAVESYGVYNLQMYEEDLVEVLRRFDGVQVANIKIQNFKEEFNSRGEKLGLGHLLGDTALSLVGPMLKEYLEKKLEKTGIRFKIYNSGPVYNIIFTGASKQNMPEGSFNELLKKGSEFRKAVTRRIKEVLLDEIKDRLTRAKFWRINNGLKALTSREFNLYGGLSEVSESRKSQSEAVEGADALDRQSSEAAKHTQLLFNKNYDGVMAEIALLRSKYTGDEAKEKASSLMMKLLEEAKKIKKSGFAIYSESIKRRIELEKFYGLENEYHGIYEPISARYNSEITFEGLFKIYEQALEKGSIGQIREARNALIQKMALYVSSNIKGDEAIFKGNDCFKILINHIIRAKPGADLSMVFRIGGDEYGALIWDSGSETLTVIRADGNNIGATTTQHGPLIGNIVIDGQLRAIKEALKKGLGVKKIPNEIQKYFKGIRVITNADYSVVRSEEVLRKKELKESPSRVNFLDKNGAVHSLFIGFDRHGEIAVGLSTGNNLVKDVIESSISERGPPEEFIISLEEGLIIKVTNMNDWDVKVEGDILKIPQGKYYELKEKGKIKESLAVEVKTEPMVTVGFMQIDTRLINDYSRDFSILQGRADSVAEKQKDKIRTYQMSDDSEIAGVSLGMVVGEARSLAVENITSLPFLELSPAEVELAKSIIRILEEPVSMKTSSAGLLDGENFWLNILLQNGLQEVSIKHTQRNIRAIEYFAGKEKLNTRDKEILKTALWLHDISKDKPSEDYIPEDKALASTFRLLVHHLESARLAEEILEQLGYDEKFRKQVKDIIIKHMGPIEGSMQFGDKKVGFMELTRLAKLSAIEKALKDSNIDMSRKKILTGYIDSLKGGFPQPESRLERIARDIDLLDLAATGVTKVVYLRQTNSSFFEDGRPETVAESFNSALQSARDVGKNLYIDTAKEIIDNLVSRLENFKKEVEFAAIEKRFPIKEKPPKELLKRRAGEFKKLYNAYINENPLPYDGVLSGETLPETIKSSSAGEEQAGVAWSYLYSPAQIENLLKNPSIACNEYRLFASINALPEKDKERLKGQHEARLLGMPAEDGYRAWMDLDDFIGALEQFEEEYWSGQGANYYDKPLNKLLKSLNESGIKVLAHGVGRGGGIEVLLNIMLEGRINSSPDGRSYFAELNFPLKGYGPYYAVLDSTKMREDNIIPDSDAISCKGDLPADYHSYYIVPSENEKEFLIKGLSEAVERNLSVSGRAISEEYAEAIVSKLKTYEEFIAEDYREPAPVKSSSAGKAIERAEDLRRSYLELFEDMAKNPYECYFGNSPNISPDRYGLIIYDSTLRGEEKQLIRTLALLKDLRNRSKFEIIVIPSKDGRNLIADWGISGENVKTADSFLEDVYKDTGVVLRKAFSGEEVLVIEAANILKTQMPVGIIAGARIDIEDMAAKINTDRKQNRDRYVFITSQHTADIELNGEMKRSLLVFEAIFADIMNKLRNYEKIAEELETMPLAEKLKMLFEILPAITNPEFIQRIEALKISLEAVKRAA